MELALQNAVTRFQELHPESRRLHELALESLPGGNTRTLLHTAPFPVFMRKGEGSQLWDEDGNKYYDLVGELSAGLFGHSHPTLQKVLTDTIQNVGLSLGATNVYEQQYASLLCKRFGLERLRFTNSGTEANLHCLAAARKFTGRRKVMVFRGAYHGSVLSFGDGIPENNVDQNDWVLVQYNDSNGVQEAFAQHDDIAAVILEGIQGSGGFISGSTDFLRTIREQSEKAGALMILDEVMTSRLAPGGLKETLEVKPDLVTLGKYLGGGLPFGAFGGRQDIMDVFSPLTPGALAHSGTFQNNTLMLHAGYAGLSEVYTPKVVHACNSQGDDLRRRLQQIFAGSKFCVTGQGSLMYIHATETRLLPEQITRRDDVGAVESTELKKLFWLELVNAGFWVQIRGAIILNIVTPASAIDAFVAAVEGFCSRHRDLI
ncbi:Tetrapyrrole biosynthesis glutamate-1-semialdehyde aminotransferase [Penicillium soppii]|uniref:Tetrapyrrole biosynthesis glutamate-1-semialdehyde aminotransferase n=1 Tax=Penicillium soppii TaxID=69789 RepID=UPI002549950D|nr:Tetrapyrrole biosynthesis glutamate-1-semialdehyde aminotransferase [Penicillium soppii]KAJ5852332.1 Tetrapyrrole biosynthesis glutamate-1-semialdehyde aminotransferase [Penicillium soppii]